MSAAPTLDLNDFLNVSQASQPQSSQSYSQEHGPPALANNENWDFLFNQLPSSVPSHNQPQNESQQKHSALQLADFQSFRNSLNDQHSASYISQDNSPLLLQQLKQAQAEPIVERVVENAFDQFILKQLNSPQPQLKSDHIQESQSHFPIKSKEQSIKQRSQKAQRSARSISLSQFCNDAFQSFQLSDQGFQFPQQFNQTNKNVFTSSKMQSASSDSLGEVQQLVFGLQNKRKPIEQQIISQKEQSQSKESFQNYFSGIMEKANLQSKQNEPPQLSQSLFKKEKTPSLPNICNLKESFMSQKNLIEKELLQLSNFSESWKQRQPLQVKIKETRRQDSYKKSSDKKQSDRVVSSMKESRLSSSKHKQPKADFKLYERSNQLQLNFSKKQLRQLSGKSQQEMIKGKQPSGQSQQEIIKGKQPSGKSQKEMIRGNVIKEPSGKSQQEIIKSKELSGKSQQETIRGNVIKELSGKSQQEMIRGIVIKDTNSIHVPTINQTTLNFPVLVQSLQRAQETQFYKFQSDFDNIFGIVANKKQNSGLDRLQLEKDPSDSYFSKSSKHSQPVAIKEQQKFQVSPQFKSFSINSNRPENVASEVKADEAKMEKSMSSVDVSIIPKIALARLEHVQNELQNNSKMDSLRFQFQDNFNFEHKESTLPPKQNMARVQPKQQKLAKENSLKESLQKIDSFQSFSQQPLEQQVQNNQRRPSSKTNSKHTIDFADFINASKVQPEFSLSEKQEEPLLIARQNSIQDSRHISDIQIQNLSTFIKGGKFLIENQFRGGPEKDEQFDQLKKELQKSKNEINFNRIFQQPENQISASKSRLERLKLDHLKKEIRNQFEKQYQTLLANRTAVPSVSQQAMLLLRRQQQEIEQLKSQLSQLLSKPPADLKESEQKKSPKALSAESEKRLQLPRRSKQYIQQQSLQPFQHCKSPLDQSLVNYLNQSVQISDLSEVESIVGNNQVFKETMNFSRQNDTQSLHIQNWLQSHLPSLRNYHLGKRQLIRQITNRKTSLYQSYDLLVSSVDNLISSSDSADIKLKKEVFIRNSGNFRMLDIVCQVSIPKHSSFRIDKVLFNNSLEPGASNKIQIWAPQFEARQSFITLMISYKSSIFKRERIAIPLAFSINKFIMLEHIDSRGFLESYCSLPKEVNTEFRAIDSIHFSKVLQIFNFQEIYRNFKGKLSFGEFATLGKLNGRTLAMLVREGEQGRHQLRVRWEDAWQVGTQCLQIVSNAFQWMIQ